MKKYFLLSLLISTYAFGQSYNNIAIYTPKGTEAQGKQLTSGELSNAEKETLKSQILAQHPNATFLAEATHSYNCHGYAWHLSEGGYPTVWINEHDVNFVPNVSKYWTDGSYIQVCNEADADKIHYYAGDHSAIMSNTVSGKYESKWGSNIRLRHDPTDVPSIYNGSSRNYYVSTKILGDVSNLCSGTRTFFAKNIPNATYTWTYSSSLTAVGPTNQNYLDVQRNGGANGAAWVEVQISTPCSSTPVTTRKNLTVGAPATTCQEIGNGTCNRQNPLCPSQMNAWQYIGIPGSWGAAGTGFRLQVSGGGYFNNGLTIQDITTSNFSVYVPGGGANVTVWAMNSCGVSGNTPYVVSFYPKSYGCYGSYYMVSPNPAGATVTVTEKEPEAGQAAENRTVTELNIYDQQGTLQKHQKYGKLKTATINVSALKTGIYFIEIGDGTYKERQQLIIQR